VKGKKGNVDLKAGEKVKLGDFKVGDKVVVKYADGAASSVKAVKAPKAKKAEPKADAKPAVEKKADAPKAAPAPAAAPAAKPAEKK
jgi:sulfate adenylyltransferase subunit 1 (EFTu-like GTPase family)